MPPEMTLTFEQKLANYAELAVRVGVGLQPGQRLIVNAPVATAELARLIVEKAYQAGARLVDVIWDDDATTLARFRYAPRDSFEELATWRLDAMMAAAERGDAVLSIRATDPDLLAGQDPELVATLQRVTAAYRKPYSVKVMSNAFNWNLISAPLPAWAQRIFPQESAERAVELLWEAIFQATRADQPDPVRAWQQHLEALEAARTRLNDRQFDGLRFKGPGTDLFVGLPERHVWAGGSSQGKNGTTFVANIPTEEVFTAPHRDRTEGTVSATKPLAYAGNLIEGIRLRFEGGRVVEANATRGQDILRKLVETDEGSQRLGEVALVPNSSPISQLGLLFFNTLYDENAASHIAIGSAYRFNLEGGEALSEEEFGARGGNTSLTHVDWMIGSGELDVIGVHKDGREEPVMLGGEWALQ